MYAVGSEVVDLAVLAFRLSAGSRLAWSLSALVVGLEAVGLYAVGLEVVDSAVLAFRRWQ